MEIYRSNFVWNMLIIIACFANSGTQIFGESGSGGHVSKGKWYPMLTVYLAAKHVYHMTSLFFSGKRHAIYNVMTTCVLSLSREQVRS